MANANEQPAGAAVQSAEHVDPAADVATNTHARDGAKKRRDPNEPAAVVGIGASAGGIAPLRQFFEEMSTESGLAFVVVMHLSPDFESQLASVIQQKTAMAVVQVNEPVKVRPNHVYVIPPNHQLTFEQNTLQLVPPQHELGRRVTIDLFFRTLAQAYGQRAVSIIMSGTDSDGVIGLKHVRAQGGVTIAQEPAEAEFDSMPQNAIAAGAVDWVLRVADMPRRLLEFVRNEHAMQLPPEIVDAVEADVKVQDAPGGETVSDETREPGDEEALALVLKHLRAHTNHDFAHYKRATVLRRIARRLQVNSLDSIPRYLEFMREHPAEVRALLDDLLIGVTHFFRDRDAFAALEANVPQLFAGKKYTDQLRVWVAGCATGEEAYSIAMLLCEHAVTLSDTPGLQIFATDIDEQAINHAREGVYPATIEADVSPERLRRFFTRDGRGYRVKKDLRDNVLFAAHNVLSDPAFSRLDLVSCRNLLIYLTREAQMQVFDVFHFALRSGGLLFVGGAESADQAHGLFSPLDPHYRIYVRRSLPRPTWRIPRVPEGVVTPQRWRAESSSVMLPRMASASVEGAGEQSDTTTFERQERRSVLFGELHLKLLEEYGPPSVVVNAAHDIVHLSENAGRYLTFRAGEPSTNLIAVVNPALRAELRTALFRGAQSRQSLIVPGQRVEVDGQTETIDIHVRPIRPGDSAHGFFLVLFEKKIEPLSAQAEAEQDETASRDVGDELHAVKDQLNATVEQFEASSEQLKASNEELQAMNEELRSAAEELETSKEEVQSVNEELITVNQQLKEKVEELSRANGDLNNLMRSTDLATIFLDRQLCVLRFTPRMKETFNLLAGDVGRPISDITHKLRYENLLADAELVLERLLPIEREVEAANERTFLARIAPYRTVDDKISGVVLTLVDVTQIKRAQAEVRAISRRLDVQAHRFDTIMDAVPDFVYEFDLDGRFTYVNPSLLSLWGVTAEEAIGKNFHQLDYTRELATKLQRQIQEVIDTRHPLKDETPYTSRIGERMYEYLFFPLFAEDGKVEAVAGVTRDITDRRRAEAALRESEERFREFAENSADVFWILDAKTQQLEYVNPVYEKMFGQPRSVIMRDRTARLELVPAEDREEAASGLPRALAGETFVRNYRIIRPTDGETRWIRDTVFPIRDSNGSVVRIAGVAQDVTEDKKRAEALGVTQERFHLLVEGARDYAMFLLDPANVITYWSKGAERVFGWSSEEAVGQSGELIFTPEDRAREEEEKEIDIALRDGTAPDQRWHLRKDGTRIWVDGVMRRLDDEETGALRGFAKIARDASEQHRIEEELRYARDQLEQRVLERTADLMATNNQLQHAMTEREQLERELLEISERERRRVGQDLHDLVCQELTATALFLKSAANKTQEDTAGKALSEAAQIVNRNVAVARDLARGFQPTVFGPGGLTEALRGLCKQANQQAGIHCILKLPKVVRIRDESLVLNLFRITQEAVRNAISHSGGDEIVICIERERDFLRLVVEDNGKGFRQRKRSKGLGLHIMRYRANVLGGTVLIDPRPKGGTKVTCEVPIKSPGGGQKRKTSAASSVDS